MRVKLKADYSLEFLDGVGELNENDDLVVGIEVVLEVETNSREKLAIGFQRGEIDENSNLYSAKMSMYKQPDGTWHEMIPREILKISGLWTFQIFREVYNRSTDPIAVKASTPGTFTINPGIMIGDKKVTESMVSTVWDGALSAKDAAFGYRNEAREAADAALEHASSAASSATNAGLSAQDAKSSYQLAHASALNADASESNAKDSATSAEAAKTACKEIQVSVEKDIEVIDDYKKAAESAQKSAVSAATTALKAESDASEHAKTAVRAKDIAVSAKDETVLKAEKVNEQYEKVNQLAGNIDNALTFSTYKKAVEYFNETNADYAIGKSIYIVTKDVPDLWIADIATEPTQYTYTSDADFLRDLHSSPDGMLKIGKYFLAEAEGAKVFVSANIEDGEGVGSIKSSNTKDDNGADYSTIVGYGENALPEASGHEAFAMGKGAKARGKRSFAFGSGALATGVTAVAIGQAVQATNNGALAFGNNTEASGEYSTATGQQTVAKGSRSFAGGWKNKANKSWSAAFGVENTVGSEGTSDGAGQGAFVAGMYNIVDGYVSTVFGTHNISKAQKQLIAGYKNTASKAFQTVLGYYNSNKEDTLLEVGNGEDGKTSNAFEVYKSGYAKAGRETTDDDDDLVLATKGYAKKYGGAGSGNNNSNIENGKGDSTIQQKNSSCETTGDFAVSFGVGGKYVGSSTERNETSRVLKAISDAGEAVYCEYGTTKYQVVIKENADSCVNQYDAYFGTVSGNYGCYVLTSVSPRKFSSFSMSNTYGYTGVNKGNASLITGTKQYNGAKYSFVTGTQNIVGDNKDNTYNNAVYGSFNIVKGAKNSLVGGKFNTVIDGQHDVVLGNNNTVNDAIDSIVGGRDNNATSFYNSIAVGTHLTVSGESQAVFGTHNSNKEDTLLEVGNGEDGKLSNAFEVYKDGTAKLSGTAEADDDVTTVADVKKIVKESVGDFKSETWTFLVKDGNGNIVTTTKEILLK